MKEQTLNIFAEDVTCEKTGELKNSLKSQRQTSQKLLLPAGIKPYYHDEDAGIVIYNSDCREILPHLPKVDLVLTDPPYPDYHIEAYKYEDGIIDFLKTITCRQFVFWSAKVDFPLDYTAIHIWDKKVAIASVYERIIERNGQRNYKMFRHCSLQNKVATQMCRDVFTGHPSQKPIQLIAHLIAEGKHDTILDPFMGSGTTLVAAKQLGRKAIGIEIEERYCQIAVKRLAQDVFRFE